MIIINRNISTFIANLNLDGFKFEIVNDRLSVSSAKSITLTEEQKQFIKDNQKQIIEFISNSDANSSAIRKRNDKTILPLSFAQQRLWFLDKLYKDKNYAYNMPIAYTIKGSIDLNILERSFNQVIERHEILRTIFGQNVEGDTCQRILPYDSSTKIQVVSQQINSADLDMYLTTEALRGFDLSSGPLLRVYWFELLDNDEKVLFINQHHIISDNWSLGLLLREVSCIYKSLKSHDDAKLPSLGIQYADYVLYEREELQDNLVDQFDYWSEHLKGYKNLNLLTAANRPESHSNNGKNISFNIENETISMLKKYAKECNATVHMVLLSLFYVMLYRYSEQADIVIGVPSANRASMNTENILGFFVNMLPLRINANDPTVDELVACVKGICINGYQNQNYPFDCLVDQLKVQRDNTRTPIFQVAFAHYTVTEDLILDGCLVAKRDFDRGTAKYDLNMTFEMNEIQLKGELEFNTSLFGLDAAKEFVNSYKEILKDAMQNPKSKISTLRILSKSSYDEIVYKNNICEIAGLRTTTMHQLFEQQAQITPNHIALVFGNQQLTYKELNARANQLADLLKFKYKQKYNEHINSEVFIGLHIERSLETIVAILGVLKSGAAYVPFDVDSPSDRLEFQISDSNCRMILNKSDKNAELLRVTKEQIPVISFEEIMDELSKYSSENASCHATVNDPIYVIYTSGSTGKPKGVVQLHKNVSRLFSACENQFQFTAQDVWTLFHSYSFDFSVWEMWGALLYGGKLIVPTYLETRNLHQFYDLLDFHKVTVLNQTPSSFYELAKIDMNSNINLNNLRYIVFGGELLKIQQLKDWIAKYGLDRPELINMYGITEITVHATYKKINHDDLNKNVSNIGKPLNDLTAYILDRNLNPLPKGVPGELYIGGNGLAKCYLNLPQLTAQKFIHNPFASEFDRTRNFNLLLYKTGDIVRWLENGDLEYLGRNDNQIQLRGFRVELEEIEIKLSSHPLINNVAVICKDRAHEDGLVKYLCAYYTVTESIHSGQSLATKELRDYLFRLLPEHMIPSYFVPLNNFPLTINGKIDKGALPEPNFDLYATVENFIEPRSELEQKLCMIWQNLLGLTKVSINSNFFELGGNSILLIRLVARMKNELDLNLSLVDVFAYPNIKALADYLTGSKSVNNTRHIPKAAAGKCDIAVIGYSGAFSGCESIEELWENICNGHDCITRLDFAGASELGVPNKLLQRKEYILATGLIADSDKFDADFFGISPSEAKFIDPQTRLFMQNSWQALEQAGYVCKRQDLSIGVFAGAGKPTYLYNNLATNPTIEEDSYDWEMDTLADPRRIATLTSFYLNLRGPAIFLDTACSTSMVAIVEAAVHLQEGLCDLAIAGGSTLYYPENFGYMYKNSMVGSADGFCAPFSKDASGIVPGSGVGVVVLKRLDDAIKDNDTVFAVIKGYGINNDGKRKVGYVAPSVQGQKDCILSALAVANVPSESISYIECHGTGTKLGDSIEISVLKDIFTTNVSRQQKQFLGSIKANIGHTDTAAGIAGFIKVCKMFESKKITPQINCAVVSDQLKDENVAFTIATQTQDWDIDKYPRRAGVTSLGIGGTNVHVILEEPCNNLQIHARDAIEQPTYYLLAISAKSAYSLTQAKYKLLAYLKKSNSVDLRNISYTLLTAREEFSNRCVVIGKDRESIISTLNETIQTKDISISENVIAADDSKPVIVFLCSMVGRQCFDLNDDLYRTIPLYRQQIDKCRNIIKVYLDEDFDNILNQTYYTDLVAFVVSYALSQLLISYDVRPNYLVGIEAEEYLSACISGVLSLEDALCVIINRLEMSDSTAKLRNIFSKITLNEPKIPFLSSASGTIITQKDAIDVNLWCQYELTATPIAKSLSQLPTSNLIFIDIGLGSSLFEVVKSRARSNIRSSTLISMLKGEQGSGDYGCFLNAIGKLWLQGVSIDWNKFYADRECHRVALPTYSFEKKRFWVAAGVPSKEAEEQHEFSHEIQNINNNEMISKDSIVDKLATFWSKVFEQDDIDINANFFDLGGNSVIAIRLVQLVSDSFNLEISINTFFENPTIATFSQVLAKNLTPANSAFKQLIPDVKNAYEPFILTDIQRAYVLGRQNLFDLGNVATHAYIERDYHDLDINKVESTFNQLIARHSMLRVVFDAKSITQRILPDVPYYKIQVQQIDAFDKESQEMRLNDWREEMSHQVLDITTWPIFDIRCSILSDKIKIHLSFDVLVLDGQSLNILMAEWTKLYNQPNYALPKLDCGFRDCVINYQELKETQRYMRDRDYWLNRVSSFPPRPNLPLREHPEKIKSPTFKRCAKYIDLGIWKKFTDKCNSIKPNITPTAALALIYGIVLARWSKNDHFAINMTFFNRLPLHSDISNVVGDFTSLELLEFNLAEFTDLNFFQQAAKLQLRLYNDLDHVLFSGVEMQRELNKISGNYKSVSYPIVFTSLLSLNMQGGAFLSDSLIDDTTNDITQTSQVWLDNKAYMLKQGFVAEWDYVEELFPEGMIESMHASYCKMIEYLADADWNSAQLPELLDNETLSLINSVNLDIKNFPEKLLHEPFFAAAKNMPNKLAVISDTGNLTYAEMAVKSNRLANCLKQSGAAPNMLIAVIMHKGWEQLVACYGILQSGAAYLPIDPDWPLARIIDVLAQGHVHIILTQSPVFGALHNGIGSDYCYVCIDNESSLNGYSAAELPRQQTADDIAYVLFTSGSTGKPKGAALTHRNVANTLFDVNARFNVNSTDVILALSNLTFDLSVYDTFAVLAVGGTIVMPASSKIKDPGSWVPLMIEHKVTLWNSVPMYMRMLMEYAPTLSTDYLNKLAATLRIVMLSGDWIPLDLPNNIKSIFNNVDVNSLGGPTECSIWSITYKIKNIDPLWTSIPYGKALANQTIYVLNDRLEYCPIDVEGYIYIGGVGVGKCYWEDNILTAEKFIIHPVTGERMFRSGDLGRLKKDGNIEILGREDNQVKISGYRIETGEIKKAIEDLEGVATAIVITAGDKLSDKRLVAYVVWKQKKNGFSEMELLKFKQSRLNLRNNDLSNEIIKLQQPQMTQKRIEAYFKRKSYRRFTNAIIDGQNLEKLFKLRNPRLLNSDKALCKNLNILERLNILMESMHAYHDKELVLPKYYYPSAGSLYPVQIYITLNNQQDKNANGSYYYNPHEHLLYKINNYCAFAESELVINFVSNLDAILPVYNEWAGAFCELECGYISDLFDSACKTLDAKLHQLTTKEDVLAKLQCRGNSKYHYSLAIDFSDSGIADCKQDFDIPKELQIYVYIKSDRVRNFDGGLYRWEQGELKYDQAWLPSDEYLNQIGMLGSTMRSAALVIFFVDETKNNNYAVGKISQNLVTNAIDYNIGSCSLGFFATNLGGIFSRLQDNLVHTIVMGNVSEQQMLSHDYSEADKSLWDVKHYINNKLKNVLPRYMLPEGYFELDNIPLSANGKVNIKALPIHNSDIQECKKPISPKNETERKISELWCEVLNLKQVSINDNFFEIGGNSIKVIILRNKLNEKHGFNLDIIDLFSNPTIRLLAEKICPKSDVEVSTEQEENPSESIKKRKKMINRFKNEYEEA